MKKKHKYLFVLIFILLFNFSLKAENVKLLINKDYLWNLLKYIENAKQEIIISSFLWCCDPKKRRSFPCELVDKIVDAVKRGVDVTIIFEKSYRDELQCNIITPLWFKYEVGKKYSNFHMYYDSPLIKSHQKVVLIDGKYCFIGSHNLTQSALKYNNEVSVLIESKEIYKRLKKFLMSVEKHGEKIY